MSPLASFSHEQQLSQLTSNLCIPFLRLILNVSSSQFILGHCSHIPNPLSNIDPSNTFATQGRLSRGYSARIRTLGRVTCRPHHPQPVSAVSLLCDMTSASITFVHDHCLPFSSTFGRPTQTLRLQNAIFFLDRSLNHTGFRSIPNEIVTFPPPNFILIRSRPSSTFTTAYPNLLFLPTVFTFVVVF
ncbi:hypothetical protein Zmor_014054 [Zophobas morio]|uniref:Uncharacterized protein n=1 Tax=Zophobas morio TaxID=2755281 RepID=A0AA38IGA4_9CUCU|nr:hypothetical protein Zmor_014054 [Zophobas morio]